MITEERYISRCIQLAKQGAGYVAPNPMVGSVLVYEDKIIGEGYHQKYGEAHAEVNCINSVKEEHKSLIDKSTLYVSLEPCSHYGKTPPCSDLIINNKIKKVVIGSVDIYKEVAGRGIQKLKDAGIEVITEVFEKESLDLNRRFFTFHEKFRPYIILKWAQSSNGKIGRANERVFVSNDYSNRLVHKWRSEEAAILTGTNTVLKDNPSLTTRLWRGRNPTRIVIDKQLQLPLSSKAFDKISTTIIFNLVKNSTEENLVYIKLFEGALVGNENFLGQLLHTLFEMNIQSVIVEGGTVTIQNFIDLKLWDEARIIINEKLFLENGIAAPEMKDFILKRQERYSTDVISYFTRNSIVN